MSKKRLVIGNWKQYISTPQEAKKYLSVFRNKVRTGSPEVWIAPAFTIVSAVSESLKKNAIKVGAQSVSSYTSGAHTGEVSPQMLKAVGAKFAIIGHSERRAIGESDTYIAESLAKTVEAGLSAVLCVGETQRDESGNYFESITSQLTSALAQFPRAYANKLIIAYEPVWAIGKSAEHAMKPGELQEMQIFIRKILADLLGRERAQPIVVIYGGAVEPENAYALLHEGGVAGFLVGHASADPKPFAAIVAACAARAR